MGGQNRQIEVVIGGKNYKLDIEEPVFPDRTCGQWTGGWMCSYGVLSFFVQEDGGVYAYGSAYECGIAPAIRERLGLSEIRERGNDARWEVHEDFQELRYQLRRLRDQLRFLVGALEVELAFATPFVQHYNG